MTIIANSLETTILVLKVALVSIAAIALAYAFIIPTWFPAYKAYTILIFVCLISTVIAGWIGYQGFGASGQIVRVTLGTIYALLDVTVVLTCSLFIILNIRGS
jgi:hypothetical protein